MERLNGASYKGMIDYGARNLVKNCSTINQLNVFPVPDGDTGTNMVTTIVKGLQSVEDSMVDLALWVYMITRTNNNAHIYQSLNALVDSSTRYATFCCYILERNTSIL